MTVRYRYLVSTEPPVIPWQRNRTAQRRTPTRECRARMRKASRARCRGQTPGGPAMAHDDYEAGLADEVALDEIGTLPELTWTPLEPAADHSGYTLTEAARDALELEGEL